MMDEEKKRSARSGKPAGTHQPSTKRKPTRVGKSGGKPFQKVGDSAIDSPSKKKYSKAPGKFGAKPAAKGQGAKRSRPLEHAPKAANELDFGIKLVYEDDTIIVIDKPAGLLTVATDKESERTAFKVVRDYLSYGTWQERRGRAMPDSRNTGAYLGVVHRLDRDTSGIMFFVKSQEARDLLTHDWQAKVSDRRYLAIVEGVPKEPEGTIRNWLRQNKALRVYSIDHAEPDAEEAITHYKLIKEVTDITVADKAKRSLIELKLETGRTNQIRVHMADLGCPIVGDRKYGAAVVRGRLALHARRIAFTHPETGKEMVFESPLPQELKKLLRAY